MASPGCGEGDPWFKDCEGIECRESGDLRVAVGRGCMEETVSLYTHNGAPAETEREVAERLLLQAEWLDGPPAYVKYGGLAGVGRRSVVFEVEAPPHGRLMVKVFKKPSGASREAAVLGLLRGSPLAPRMAAVLRVDSTTYMVAVEPVEGEPMAGRFIESGVESLWRGEPRLPVEARLLGHAVRLLHDILARRCNDEWCRPKEAGRSEVESWIGRVEARARMLRKLGRGYDAAREAAETLEWLAGEWRSRIGLLVGSKVQVIHGDLHLYQVYLGPGGRVVFTDFEGEPVKAPGSPWDLEPRERDLAALGRSIVYAAAIAVQEARSVDVEEAAREALTGIPARWARESFMEVLAGYGEGVDEARLRFWLLERLSYEAVYEFAYETGYHPVPLWSLLSRPEDYLPP